MQYVRMQITVGSEKMKIFLVLSIVFRDLAVHNNN